MPVIESKHTLPPQSAEHSPTGQFVTEVASINGEFYIDISKSIGTEVFERNGKQVEAEVVCRLEWADHPFSYTVLRQPKGDGYIIRRRDERTDKAEGEKTEELISLGKAHIPRVSLAIPSFSSTIQLGLVREQEILSVYYGHSENDSADPVVLLVGGEQQRSQDKMAKQFKNEQYAGERQRKRRRRALALGFMALFSSRGPVDKMLDMTMDQSNAATEILEERRVEPEDISPDNGGVNAEIDQIEDRLRTSLHDLDVENYEAINERAEAFRASYPEGAFLTSDQKAELTEGLKGARDFTELYGLLSPFLERYHVKFNIGINNEGAHGASLDLAKQFAIGIVDVLDIFPSYEGQESKYSMLRSFQDLFDLSSINLLGDSMKPLIEGMTSTSDGSISLNISGTSNLLHTIIPDNEVLLAGGATPEAVFAHELGHTATYNTPDLSYWNTDHGMEIGKALIGFFGGIVNYRIVPSVYAASDPEEGRAEQFRGFLTVGIEDPNNSLAFESPFNMDLMKMLINYEQEMPGFVDQLLSHTTVEHVNQTGTPQVEGLYHAIVFALLGASLLIKRDSPNYNNLLRRAGLS